MLKSANLKDDHERSIRATIVNFSYEDIKTQLKKVFDSSDFDDPVWNILQNFRLPTMKLLLMLYTIIFIPNVHVPLMWNARLCVIILRVITLRIKLKFLTRIYLVMFIWKIMFMNH